MNPAISFVCMYVYAERVSDILFMLLICRKYSLGIIIKTMDLNTKKNEQRVIFFLRNFRRF